MAAKKKGSGKGRGPSNRPPSPAKRTTVPKAQQSGKGAAGTPRAGSGGPSNEGDGSPGAAGPVPTSGKQSASKGSGGRSSTPTGGRSGRSPDAGGKSTGSNKPSSGKPSSGKPSSGKPSSGKPSSGKPATAKDGATTTPKGGQDTRAKSTPQRPRGGPTRSERLAAAKAAQRRKAIRNRVLLVGVVAAAVLAIGFTIVSDRRDRASEAAMFNTASCEFDRMSDDDGGSGAGVHVSNPTYEVNPPAGGPHLESAAGAGAYSVENLPPDGSVVHAMEHGYVIIWHRGDLDEETFGQLGDLADRRGGETLLVARPTLPTPVAATAWEARVLCDTVEIDTLDEFVTTFVDRGPESGFIDT